MINASVKVDSQNLLARLKGMKPKGKVKAAARVGYVAAYSIFVHENLNSRHTVGQAKYLSSPAVQNIQQIGEGVAEVYREKRSISRGVMTGARMLRDLSVPLVPVDTGLLKSSVYVRAE